MRKLASIQKILKTEPIINADSIEKATVLGWNIVIKKDEFKTGDSVIYVEIDSVLPEMELFEFLRNKKFVIKTVKLRGQVSQGICFPISVLEKFIPIEKINQLQEGDDVTAIIGIKKYEIPIPINMRGKIKGAFPGSVPKTDETRIQSIPQILETYKGTECFITEKVDGASMTIYFKNGEYGVCSRNLDMLKDDTNVFWLVSEKLNLENKIKDITNLLELKNIAIQGELIGTGMQGNKYKLKSNSFLAFNIFDIDNYKYVDFDIFVEVCEKVGIDIVPVLDKNFILNKNISELVELSKGYSVLNKDTRREGIVIRSLKEISNVEEIGRFSFKVINPDFLLKYNE